MENTKFKTAQTRPIPKRVQIKINEYLASKGREVKPDEQIKNKN